jgi:hypothetical protein
LVFGCRCWSEFSFVRLIPASFPPPGGLLSVGRSAGRSRLHGLIFFTRSDSPGVRSSAGQILSRDFGAAARSGL